MSTLVRARLRGNARNKPTKTAAETWFHKVPWLGRGIELKKDTGTEME
jgi:hypothetical protein